MKKGGKIRFYSKEELSELKAIAESQTKINPITLETFCKKYNRSFLAVSVKIYGLRNTLRKITKNPAKNDVAAKMVPISQKQENVDFKKGEFHIPIKNWRIVQNAAGEMTFVAKF